MGGVPAPNGQQGREQCDHELVKELHGRYPTCQCTALWVIRNGGMRRSRIRNHRPVAETLDGSHQTLTHRWAIVAITIGDFTGGIHVHLNHARDLAQDPFDG